MICLQLQASDYDQKICKLQEVTVISILFFALVKCSLVTRIC